MARYLVGKIQRSQVLALLRSLYRQSSSGQLEIEYDQGSETVYFISGAIYLHPNSPLVGKIVEWADKQQVGAPGQAGEDLARTTHPATSETKAAEACLAEVFSRWVPRSMRFVDSLKVNAKELVGPFQTDLLLDHLGAGPAPRPPIAGAQDKRALDEAKVQRKASSVSVPQPPDPSTTVPTRAAPASASHEATQSPHAIIPGPWTSQAAALQHSEDADKQPSSPSSSAGSPSPAKNREAPSSGSVARTKGSDAGAVWLEHFGLRESPFSLTPDPSYFFTGGGHVEALAGLKLGLIEKRGLIVLVGEVGTGKTTIVYSLLSSLGPETETAYVSNPSLSFDEILESALKDLGAELAGDRRLDRLEALNDFLLRAEESGKSVAIVIDEAQGLSRRGYEQLRLLLNFETFKNKLLQIVLVGQPELAQRLARPELRQIADRIAVRCHLKPLKGSEAEKYFEHRLEAAGGSPELFTLPGRKLLIRAAKGNPRRINVIGHNAMIIAFAKGAGRVDRTTVAEAVRDIKR